MKQQWNDKTGRWEPPTNADRIRGESNSWLAATLHEAFCNGMIYMIQATREDWSGAMKESDYLDWLQQPVEE